MNTVPIHHFEVKDPEKSEIIDGTSKAAHSLGFEQQDNYLSLSIDNISANLLDRRKFISDGYVTQIKSVSWNLSKSI